LLHSHRYSYHQEDILTLLPRLLDAGADSYCNINSAVWGHREDPSRSLLSRHWADWIGEHLGEYEGDSPRAMDRCCAQFLVTRGRVLARPVEFYERALEVLDRAEPGTEESREGGLVMEWIWHIVFGEDFVVSEVEELARRADTFDVATLEKRPWCAP
jgi:hypothetical protein